jgi:hypothetical protein
LVFDAGVVREGCGGIEVVSKIDPVRAGAGMVFSEVCAVKLANKILIA